MDNNENFSKKTDLLKINSLIEYVYKVFWRKR